MASQASAAARHVPRRETQAPRPNPPLAAVRRPDANPFIARLQAENRLDEGTLENLRSLCQQPKKAAAKQQIVAEGVRTGNLHILLGGWASRCRDFPNGRRQITALLLPGDICDIDNLYIEPPSQSVEALTQCEFATISRAQLKHLMHSDAGFMEAMGRRGALENIMQGERNASLGQRPARERIAHLLCELRTRLEATGDASGSNFRVPLTQVQLGEVLGLTSIHVNRVLKTLRAQNLVEKRRDRLTILDWHKLTALAGFSAAYLHVDDQAGAEADYDGEGLDGRDKGAANSPGRSGGPAVSSIDRAEVLECGSRHGGALREAIHEALRLSPDTRIRCNGPDLQLTEPAVMTITLALHELHTDALKHGALSTAEGSIELFWKVVRRDAGAQLWMQWSEHDGPAIRPPDRKRFGTKLITQGTGRALGGLAEVDYTPAGLTWILTAPLARIVAA